MVSTLSELGTLIGQQRNTRVHPQSEIDVADQLRRLRVKHNLLVRELAKLAGLSTRTLRKIEAGETSPTISTLQQLLAALGVSFDDFFAMAEPAPGDRRGLNPNGAGKPIRSPNCQHRLLSNEILHKKMLPMATTVLQVDATATAEWDVHAGEAFILVLSGCVTLLTEHYAPTVMREGDSVYFDCSTGYRLCSEEGTTAEVLWLTSLA